MKRQILISLVILLTMQTLASAAVLYVPSRDYPTIQSAINVANDGDEVVVAPGVYTGTNNVDLDFSLGNGQMAITVRSEINPDNPNPDIIAATIIDCQGDRYNPHRAFRFHSGEGNNSRVLGFTIINGYAQGPVGAAGAPGYDGDPVSDFIPIPPCAIDSPNDCPPYALDGADGTGDGYGGAILCEGASPTIQYCVITNCTVTGGQGGDGAPGLDGTWEHWTIADVDPCTGEIDDVNNLPTANDNGQWGGHGGAGSGNGYGGAIACRAGSTPIISDCTISDNSARGGCGGDGGNGGMAADEGATGDESGGGDAGDSTGDGMGGGIYADGSSPIITNCTFSNNVATTGARGEGGQRGLGGVTDPRAPEGSDGLVFPAGHIAGGAAYYGTGSNANFTNCTFTGNKAYEAYTFYFPQFGEDISAYTVGGALYSHSNSGVNLDTCEFIGNLGGAVYCGTGCNLNFDDCLFTDNSETANGGALHIGPGGTVDIQSCLFGGNSAYDDGGALKCRSNATLTNCSFGNNRANSGYGGAMDAYESGTTLTVNFNNCSFTGNQAIYGGGFSSENFIATTFTDCYFIGNTAQEGGGLDLVNGDISVTGGVVKGNNATDGDGGGFNCSYTTTEIRDCTIADNFANGVYPSGGKGGAINFYGSATTQTVFNCLITGNSAAVDGGAIFCHYASPEIGNCTFSDNLAANGYGGAIFSDFVSEPSIIDSIFEGCNNHAIHEEDYGGNAIVTFSLFYDNPDGDYYDSDTGLQTGADNINNNVTGAHDNIDGDPLFVSGDLGDYYLSQIAAGQGSDSPAINNGSATAASLGLGTFTTRTDNVGDADQVDRGYHYPDVTTVAQYQLTAGVIGGQGTIEPATGYYYAGTVVTLTATPVTGWWVKAWSGTDDDSSTATTNSVVMNSDRTVTIEFRQPRTLIVAVGGGGEGYYSTIQDAVSDAEDGDTIVVYPGIYYGGYLGVSVYVDKSITIRSMYPDDPSCVAATIIDGYNEYQFNEGYNNSGVTFGPYANADTILNGFTIQNCGGYWGDADDGTRTNPVHPDGWDAGGGSGAAITIYPGGGPVIKNCVIRDNLVLGGNAGNGVVATGPPGSLNAGRGGWGGFAYGGAVYCGTNSSPTFINCQIIDNIAQGGNGGDGGNEVDPGGLPNYGGNWSMRGTPEYPALDIDPFSSTITPVIDGDLWEVWQWDLAAYYLSTFGVGNGVNYIGDYRWYSGYGGGVFCDEGSTVTFTDCTISGNLAQGGVSGQGGESVEGRPLEPLIPYEIPSFGGGVYCAAEATITFTGCTITENIASEPNENNSHIDPYLGHGGGVCAEDTAAVVFTDCTFSENQAAVGGGLHFADANPVISDCNFISNSAYQGGGLFGEHGPATIRSSNFTDNIASSDANEPNALGQGGAMHFWATDANIIDCNISSNQTETSGGGVYFGGEGTCSLTNCLLTKNTAGRGGGAVSTNIFTQLTVSNCTIANNTGITYGGGLNCSYGSYTDIINSIVWNNVGIHGSQVAVGTGFEYDESPSTVDITYSDIQDPNIDDVPPLDIVFCIDTTASMADDINSVKASAVQIINHIVDTAPDYRIAVVDYRDFNELPYGNPGIDYEYNDVLVFTDNDQATVDAINSLTIGIGGDIPESVYSGLMHCIDGNSLGGWRADGVNRVIILMGDASPHDPEPFTDYTLDDVVTAATLEPPKTIFSILIGYDEAAETAAPYFEELAEETGGIALQAANAGDVVDAVMTAISLIMPAAGFYAEAGCTINGFDFNPTTNRWDPNSNLGNISEDPNFIGGYLLSQGAAGQEVNSPCWNTGSDLASVFGLDTYTTRTDSIPDDANVDMGYHYNLFLPIQYQLVFMALDVEGLSEANQPAIDPNMDLNDPNEWYSDYTIFTTVELAVTSPPDDYDILWSGTDNDDSNQPTNTVTMLSDRIVTVTFVKNTCQLTVEAGPGGTVAPPWSPGTHTVKRNKEVELEAVPDEGYRVKQWIGSDDDTSTDPCNIVTVDSDKTVRVEFELPATIGVPGDYSSIQQALDAAEEGDTILISPGTYTTSTGYLINNKVITISSVAPDDPCVVAATVIEMEIGEDGYINTSGFMIYNVGPETVLNGITIRGFVHQAYSGLPGDELGEDGYNGGHAFGGGIICYMASPTIKNCIIADCNVIGGNGGNGYDGSGDDPADPNIHGTDGGWPGRAYGGGLACLAMIDPVSGVLNASNPAIINCTFENCSATGGNGGDGGNGSTNEDAYGMGGRGGGWYYGEDSRWYNETWHNSSQDYERFGPAMDDFYDFYTEYTGRGGAVLVGEQCSPTFTNCTFTNNRTEGGTCGITGLDGWPPVHRVEPSIHWQIDNFGGAVYCETNSSPTFVDCTFTGNTADTNTPADNDDPYVSYGGAVAWETDANVTFESCTFNNNSAATGGAMYWSDANAQIADSNISGNFAYLGGGMFGTDSFATIHNCLIQNNFAGAVSEDINDDVAMPGQGGGIYSASMESQIKDCTIIGNEAIVSGGGILFTGTEASSPTVTNCLVVGNQAGRDGGGLSVNWYATPLITNCTVVGNEATGDFGIIGETGLGGGIYTSYDGYTVILDSILWNNYALEGQEIAIGTGFEYDPRPSTVNVSYSDVKGGATEAFVDTGCTLNWGAGNIYSDPCFVTGPLGDYYLSQTDTNDPNQTTDSPCVDTGSDLASSVGLHLYTTRTDEVFDTNTVDMGYHYPLAHPIELCGLCDLSKDGIVNFADLALLSWNWGGWHPMSCLAGGTWNGTINSNTHGPIGTISNWIFRTDGTTEAHLELVIDGTPIAFDDYASYTESNCQLEIYDTGTVSINGDMVFYNFTITGTSDGATATGTYSLDYSEPFDWLDDSGTWQVSRSLGSVCGSSNNWCDGADLTFDGYVNFDDWVSIWECWLAEDTDPPHYSPGRQAKWEIDPYSTTTTPPYAVSMTAKAAFDNWGGRVAYYFECFTGNGSDRGWDPDRTHIDQNLDHDTVYCYRVKVRDERGNETLWSRIRCAIAGEEPPPPEDHNPPTPNPMTWATEPYATSPTSIAMVATTATDDTAGVEYYFEDFDFPGVNSGWIGVPTWTDVGLTPETTYTYRVMARDTSPWWNETGWSVPLDATTPAIPPPPDTTPPTPNPSQWAVGGEPSQYGPDPNDGYYRHTMTAEPASDAENGPVEYYFEFVAGGYGPVSSGWQLSNVYDYVVSANSAQWGAYKVRTRDAVGNMTVWSGIRSTLE